MGPRAREEDHSVTSWRALPGAAGNRSTFSHARARARACARVVMRISVFLIFLVSELSLAWSGLTWPRLGWLGLAWAGLAWPGPAWAGPAPDSPLGISKMFGFFGFFGFFD